MKAGIRITAPQRSHTPDKIIFFAEHEAHTVFFYQKKHILWTMKQYQMRSESISINKVKRTRQADSKKCTQNIIGWGRLELSTSELLK
jgi:hypothetical protein